MKKVIGLIMIMCFCEHSFSQIFSSDDNSMGYQTTGILDTVRAIILLDNPTFGRIERVEGYAVREWQIWYGGIDPYMDPSYRPAPSQWFSTGKFLYANKKEIKKYIWNTHILADPLKPIPSTNRDDKYDPIVADHVQDVDTIALNKAITMSLDSASWNLISALKTGGGVFMTDTIQWVHEKLDTTKMMIYMDEGILGGSVKLKKYKVYAIHKSNMMGLSLETKYYDEGWNELKGWEVLSAVPFDWEK